MILKTMIFFCYFLAYYSYILTKKWYIFKNNIIFLYFLEYFFSLPGSGRSASIISIHDTDPAKWYGSGSTTLLEMKNAWESCVGEFINVDKYLVWVNSCNPGKQALKLMWKFYNQTLKKNCCLVVPHTTPFLQKTNKKKPLVSDH